MLGVFAEFETNLRRERQLEGIAKAKPAGVYKDRPASIDATQVRAMKAQGLGGIGNRLTRIVGQSARLPTRSQAKFTAQWAPLSCIQRVRRRRSTASCGSASCRIARSHE
jgi:hypothetical protein